MSFGLEVPTGTGEIALTGADLMDVQAVETGASSPAVVVSTVTVAKPSVNSIVAVATSVPSAVARFAFRVSPLVAPAPELWPPP